eukprot:scaffold7742_cov59-Phaeocystis_antarctica.AAC.1
MTEPTPATELAPLRQSSPQHHLTSSMALNSPRVLTKGDEPVVKSLPYDLVKASEKIDVWALGALTFTLLTGETLIPATRDDDCASGAAMRMVYGWGTQPAVVRNVLNKVKDDAARDLVDKMLQHESSERPSVPKLLEPSVLPPKEW